MLLAILGNSWQSLAIFGNPWHSLACSGITSICLSSHGLLSVSVSLLFVQGHPSYWAGLRLVWVQLPKVVVRFRAGPGPPNTSFWLSSPKLEHPSNLEQRGYPHPQALGHGADEGLPPHILNQKLQELDISSPPTPVTYARYFAHIYIPFNHQNNHVRDGYHPTPFSRGPAKGSHLSQVTKLEKRRAGLKPSMVQTPDTGVLASQLVLHPPVPKRSPI